MAAQPPSALALSEAVEALHTDVRAGHARAALAQAHRLLDALPDTLADASADDGAMACAWAGATNRLGMFFFELGFAEEAHRAYQRALVGAERATPLDEGLLADLYNNLGQAQMQRGEMADAQSQLEKALALRRRAASEPALAVCADNLGAVLGARGQFERALALHQEARALFERAGDAAAGHLATTLGNLGSLYKRRGEFVTAQAHLLRALDMHFSRGGLGNAAALPALVNLIDALIAQNDSARADEMFGLLLRMSEGPGGAAPQPVAMALLDLGSAALRHFQLGLAERAAARAVALLDSSADALATQTLRARQLLANVQAAKGDFDGAERQLLRVLNTPALAASRMAELLIDLGKAVRNRGRVSLPAAIRLFETAAQQLRGLSGADAALRISALGNLGMAHFDADDMAAAESCTREALALCDRHRIGNDRAWLLHNLALVHYHLGRHDEARAGFEQARRAWRRRGGAHHPHVATADANLALAHWSSGNRGAAQRAFARSAQLRAGPLQRTLLVGTEAERLAASHGSLDDLFKQVTFCLRGGASPALARQTAQLLLQRKAIVLDALALTQQRLRERVDKSAQPQLDRLIEVRHLLSTRLLAAPLAGATAADTRGLAALQAEEAELQSLLSHAGAFGAAGLAPVSLAQVQAALPPRTVLIEYLCWPVFDPVRRGHGSAWDGEHYAAMLLGPRGAPVWLDLGDAQVIDADAETWLTLLRDPDSHGAALNAAAATLAERLLVPLKARLRGARTVFIAPDGNLNLLPLNLLAESVLGEQVVVSHLTCGRELLRPAEAAVPGAQVLVIVDPDYGEPLPPSRWPVPRLPGTRGEAAAIKAAFAQAQVLAGNEADVDALRRAARPALLHVATHGVFLDGKETAPLWRSDMLALGDGLLMMHSAAPSAAANPMLQAGLVLAGANRSTATQLSGFISAAELSLLDLRGTELVVLSACDTGRGSSVRGAEFAGLRRALAIAGAAAQVISLWELDDDAAAALMAAFYRRLAAGEGRAAALQQAQREIRRRLRWSHPSSWAGLVAWGSPQPLSAGVRALAVDGVAACARGST